MIVAWALVRLRFREAMAGGLLWLVPVHFVLSLAAVAVLPDGPLEERLAAGHAVALALAGSLAVVAAALLGAGPLPEERERARGALVLHSLAGPSTRAVATVLGASLSLALLTAGLLASALASVDLGVGSAGPPPRAWEHPVSLEGGEGDAHRAGVLWMTSGKPGVQVRFGAAADHDRLVEIDAAPRVGSEGDIPGGREMRWAAEGTAGPVTGVARARSLHLPLEVTLPRGATVLVLKRVPGNFDLGVEASSVRLDAGQRPRALALGLHAAGLMAGLTALLAAATAVSTLTGTGVAGAAALGMAALSLSRSLFADAARILSGTSALGAALEASHTHGSHLEAPSQGTPAAMAPLFRLLSSVVPDGTRWDLSGALSANRVPAAGETLEAVVAGLLWAAAFTALAALLARRRP